MMIRKSRAVGAEAGIQAGTGPGLTADSDTEPSALWNLPKFSSISTPSMARQFAGESRQPVPHRDGGPMALQIWPSKDQSSTFRGRRGRAAAAELLDCGSGGGG